jgi:hypothetical protein
MFPALQVGLRIEQSQVENRGATSKFSVLRQVCNYIPPHLVPKLARETGVDDDLPAH